MQLHKYQWLLQPRGVPGWVWVVHLCSVTMWYPHGMNMNHVAKTEKSSSSLPNCYLLGRGNVHNGQYAAIFKDGWQQSRVIVTTKDTISCSIFSYKDTSTYNRFLFKIEKTSRKSQISKNSSWSDADFQFFQSNQQPSKSSYQKWMTFLPLKLRVLPHDHRFAPPEIGHASPEHQEIRPTGRQDAGQWVIST